MKLYKQFKVIFEISHLINCILRMTCFYYRGKELYTELDKVNELDIFGMSPYGDQSIIDKINSKNKVRVFIYKKDGNEETKIWEKKLTCTHELIDSSEMQ